MSEWVSCVDALMDSGHVAEGLHVWGKVLCTAVNPPCSRFGSIALKLPQSRFAFHWRCGFWILRHDGRCNGNLLCVLRGVRLLISSGFLVSLSTCKGGRGQKGQRKGRCKCELCELCVRACVRACGRAGVRACVRAWVRACGRAGVRAGVRACLRSSLYAAVDHHMRQTTEHQAGTSE